MFDPGRATSRVTLGGMLATYRYGTIAAVMRSEDRHGFEAMYHAEFAVVLRYTRSRLLPESAEDATAEVFLVAWRRWCDIPENSRGWLLGVARRVVAEQLRSDRRQDALQTRLRQWASPDAQEGQEGQEGQESLLPALHGCILGALGRLREADRELLMLVAWDGLTPSTAASSLGVSPLVLRVRLHRARRRFAIALRLEKQENTMVEKLNRQAVIGKAPGRENSR